MSRFVDHFPLGQWQANCYIVGDPATQTAIVVDPGENGVEAVTRHLGDRGVRCEAILLTHGHLDHLWTAPELAAALDVPVLLHPDDAWLYENPAAAFGNLPKEVLAEQFGLSWDPDLSVLHDLRDGMTLDMAGSTITARHAPGHTPGSTVFLIDDAADGNQLMLSGDLLFAGSVGRTDLARGDWDIQQESLRTVVLPLTDDTVVAPGHGPQTTVGAERAGNPFVPTD